MIHEGEKHAYPHIHVEPGLFRLAGGLTKQELFAAMAMQGLVVRGFCIDHGMAAQLAVRHADALIKELSK
jgi:uncharacterized protein (UPF0276 family)